VGYGYRWLRSRLGWSAMPPQPSKYLGLFLYWFGVPLLILASLIGRDLSGGVLVAPITAWVALLVGAAFAWIWIDLGMTDERLKTYSLSGGGVVESAWTKRTQGSFLLAMMVGNTGYMGYPVILTLVGQDYFAWAVFYDLLGSTLGAYGLGVALASYYGDLQSERPWYSNLLRALLRNPALWSLLLGLTLGALRVTLPTEVATPIRAIAAPIVPLSLVMIGLQLSQLPSLRRIGRSLTCLTIKMLLVPLVVGTALMFFNITGPSRLAMVLQMAMPPAFATLVIAQAYDLDQELAVTTLALGSAGLLVTLPIWIWLFS
ncbi:MAG: AEC family transporter, partial [Oscillatoriales cyanobacterium SM2_2_1]|nr:AEC family transporter [Oscillatoriales cyanobacterium SM2_2_1]